MNRRSLVFVLAGLAVALVLAFGVMIGLYGLLYTYALCIAGGILVVLAMWGWALEPSVAPGHHDDHDHHEPTPEPDPAGAAAT